MYLIAAEENSRSVRQILPLLSERNQKKGRYSGKEATEVAGEITLDYI
jgi:hypothetical protein